MIQIFIEVMEILSQYPQRQNWCRFRPRRRPGFNTEVFVSTEEESEVFDDDGALVWVGSVVVLILPLVFSFYALHFPPSCFHLPPEEAEGKWWLCFSALPSFCFLSLFLSSANLPGYYFSNRLWFTMNDDLVYRIAYLTVR